MYERFIKRSVIIVRLSVRRLPTARILDSAPYEQSNPYSYPYPCPSPYYHFSPLPSTVHPTIPTPPLTSNTPLPLFPSRYPSRYPYPYPYPLLLPLTLTITIIPSFTQNILYFFLRTLFYFTSHPFIISILFTTLHFDFLLAPKVFSYFVFLRYCICNLLQNTN